MSRTRISTTVDSDRLARCRALLDQPDSEVVDRALVALLHELEGHFEREALAAAPYEDDPDLAWRAPPGPDLPYDAAIPDDVQRLAAARRARDE